MPPSDPPDSRRDPEMVGAGSSPQSDGPEPVPARRRRLRGVLVALAVVLSMLALVLGYAGAAFLTPQRFADRAVATLRDPAVSADVADRLTNAVTSLRGGDLLAVRPIVRSLAGAVVESGAFAALFHRALIDAHTAVVEHHGGTVFVDVADAGVLVGAVLQHVAPDAAPRIDAERVARLLTVHPGTVVLEAVRIARRIYGAAWVLALMAAALAMLALWTSVDRRRTMRQLGIYLAAGAVVVVGLEVLGQALAGQLAPSGRGAAARALWHGFLGGLRVQALLAATVGAIVAAAASTQVRPGALARFVRDWRSGSQQAITPGQRLALSLALVIAGLAVLLEPGAALTLVAMAAGLWLLYLGVRGVLGAGEQARTGVAVVRPRLTRVLRFAGPAVAVAAFVAVAIVLIDGGGDQAPAQTPLTCNGYIALCDRPLNDVSFAATHNSMASVTIPTFLFGQQDGTISDQLAGGIHGLLIDSYYGDAVPGGVRTDLASLPKRDTAVQELGAPAVEAAERIRSRFGHQGKGQRGIYLCHGFCELGAVSLDSALTDVRSFLVANPGEVVIIINQDEGVTPTDIRDAFEKAGLLDLVYRGPLGPFPTLREMIDSGQRLVVMAENDAGSIPWYHLAYEHALQETPYRFRSPAMLTKPSKLAASCRPNRGPASAPLFLVNHWVDTTPTPRASLAAKVNARPVLLARAETCRRIRARLPNLVAVDFYRRGDVLGVVNTLNGVGN